VRRTLRVLSVSLVPEGVMRAASAAGWRRETEARRAGRTTLSAVVIES